MNSRLEGTHQLQRRSSPMANERKQSSPKMEITKLNHELIEECKRSQEDSILSRHLRHELEKYVQIQIQITGTLPKKKRTSSKSVDNRFVTGQLPHNQCFPLFVTLSADSRLILIELPICHLIDIHVSHVAKWLESNAMAVHHFSLHANVAQL